MTQDDILRMAREAGLINSYGGRECASDELLARFAELIKQRLISEGYRKCAEGQRTTQFCGQLEAAVAAEREACAKVCDAKAKRNFNWGSENADKYHAQADWAENIAVAIRARGEK